MPRDKSRNKVDTGPSRRTVLFGSIAAIPAPVFTPAQVLEDLSAPHQAADPRQPSYRETEHIRRFYDRSRF
jgi:hypothetical protein